MRICKKEIKRILIIRMSKLGDVLFTTPLIRAIKKGFPQARIFYIVSTYAGFLLENNPYIDKLLILKDNIPKLLGKEEKFDMAINLHGEGNLLTSQLTYASGAKYRIGRDSRGLFAPYHNIKWDFNLAEESMIQGYLNVLKLLKTKYDGKETNIFLT